MYEYAFPCACYNSRHVDGKGALDIEMEKLRGSSVTIKACVATCKENGFAYAGIDSAYYCECGNTSPENWRLEPYSNCDSVLNTHRSLHRFLNLKCSSESFCSQSLISTLL